MWHTEKKRVWGTTAGICRACGGVNMHTYIHMGGYYGPETKCAEGKQERPTPQTQTMLGPSIIDVRPCCACVCGGQHTMQTFIVQTWMFFLVPCEWPFGVPLSSRLFPWAWSGWRTWEAPSALRSAGQKRPRACCQRAMIVQCNTQ